MQTKNLPCGCVATILIRLPFSATQGFFNIGDAMVMIAALTFGHFVVGITGVELHTH